MLISSSFKQSFSKFALSSSLKTSVWRSTDLPVQSYLHQTQRRVPLRKMLSSKVAAVTSSLRPALLGLAGARQKHTLPDLPYDYNALEPYVSAEIMQLHHSKHHNTYVTNLNVAEEKLMEAKEKNDVSTIIELGPALRFNGGGHLNHSIFWETLSPHGGGEPEGPILEAINRDFGSFADMKKQLSTASVTVQGSGWGWLGLNPVTKRLQVAACPNQDPLQATTGLVPLFGIDVWEHAYYLQYKNVRPDYVNAIWNIANWAEISRRFQSA